MTTERRDKGTQPQTVKRREPRRSAGPDERAFLKGRGDEWIKPFVLWDIEVFIIASVFDELSEADARALEIEVTDDERKVLKEVVGKLGVLVGRSADKKKAAVKLVERLPYLLHNREELRSENYRFADFKTILTVLEKIEPEKNMVFIGILKKKFGVND